MPRKSQVPGGSVNRKSGSSVKAIDVLPSSREEDIKNKVLNDLAVNLGVPVSDLPGDLHDAVGEQVTASLAENVKDLARNYATSHVRATLMQQFDSTNVLDDRLKGALS